MKRMKNGVKKSNIFVCVSRFPFDVDDEKISPSARAEEIEGCLSPNVRLQKFYAWKLLERALSRLGLSIEKLDIRRTDSGKWECPDCFFSLSHSGNFVVAAVSGEPVGVDVERFEEPRFNSALAKKITTERERGDISPRALAALWTRKEAIFKLSGGKSFIPKSIEAADCPTVTKTFGCEDESYFISVASPTAEKAEFISLNDLEVKGCK